MQINTGILGGGLAGLSLAYFLKEDSVAVIEKNARFGGLARSFSKKGITYDIGPHIIFSKNQGILDFINSLSENDRHRRSNQIFHKGNFIKYPFENHLAQLNNKGEIDYCLNTFVNNPYRNLPSQNMLAFFLKTFGEGITKIYLEPYNQKIWKFDPCMMNKKMVERIPKPPVKDIINSAKGKFSEGYLHQLNFTYPKKGGIQSLIQGLKSRLEARTVILVPDNPVLAIEGKDGCWDVKTKKGSYLFNKIINCMPIHELIKVLPHCPTEVLDALTNLRYNSIYIVVLNTDQDNIGDNFAVMIAQKDIIFHRVSKLDFMGGVYHLENSSTIMVEVTFREGDLISKMTKREVIEHCIHDLAKIGFISEENSIRFTDIKKEKYAYVIYDIDHENNTRIILDYLKSIGIESNGRFAEFEYLNMDQVIDHSEKLAHRLHSSP
jgi:protoporphyrinogen oxidase